MKNVAFLWAILAVSVGLAQEKPSLAGQFEAGYCAERIRLRAGSQIGSRHDLQGHTANVFISLSRY
jgi:hypothetical protein